MPTAQIDLMAGDEVGATVSFSFTGTITRGKHKVSGRYADAVERFLALDGLAYVPELGDTVHGSHPELWDWLVARCAMLSRRAPFTSHELSVTSGIPTRNVARDRDLDY